MTKQSLFEIVRRLIRDRKIRNKTYRQMDALNAQVRFIRFPGETDDEFRKRIHNG